MVEKLKIDGLEEQLAELAKILNSFKSEAVQLRILDYVLGDENSAAGRPAFPTQPFSPTKRKKSSKRTKPSKGEPQPSELSLKKKTKVGSGAKSALTQLVDGDFFNSPRTIQDIIQYCKDKLARTYRSNEFSSKLGQLAREGILTREKNADGQYEYKKP